jgi:predicted site-specific integrase-resolvase
MKEKYPNYRMIKDIGSGINFKRKGLLEIIDLAITGKLNEIVIVYKDRLCRFGYELIEYIIKKYSNGKITILNKIENSPQEEIVKDLVQIINVFSARINGLRKYKKDIKNIK